MSLTYETSKVLAALLLSCSLAAPVLAYNAMIDSKVGQLIDHTLSRYNLWYSVKQKWKKYIYIYTLHYIDVLFIYVHYQYCQTFNLKCILLLLLGLKLFCKDVFVHRSWLEVLPPRARTADPVSLLPEAWPTPKWLQKTRNGTSSRNSIYILWLHI